MAATDTLPLLEILAREPEGYSLWDGPPFSNGEPRVKLAKVPCSTSKYSEDGSRLMPLCLHVGHIFKPSKKFRHHKRRT
ncbi:hypothetical protein MKX01_020726 [Papaver californicum]|nr:hypothetical protein MKX01_020726 [Papaver californicum]